MQVMMLMILVAFTIWNSPKLYFKSREHIMLYQSHDTCRGCIAQRLASLITTPHHPRAPLFATVCCPVQQSSRTTRAPQPFSSHPGPAAAELPAAALLLPASSAAVARFTKTKTPRHPGGLGTMQTFSPVARMLITFEHKAVPFCTRHQNPYTVAT